MRGSMGCNRFVARIPADSAASYAPNGEIVAWRQNVSSPLTDLAQSGLVGQRAGSYKALLDQERPDRMPAALSECSAAW
jgi:hypothetical protein